MVTEEIWKYPIPMEILRQTSEPRLDMPIGASIISCQVQGGALCLWAIVDPEADKEVRHFAVYGTGQPVIGFSHPVINTQNFIGTVQFYDGTLVLHVFEVPIYKSFTDIFFEEAETNGQPRQAGRSQ